MFKTEVEFLGHLVGRDGVRMMQDKVKAVAEWPVPTNVGDVRAFLGTAGYYRKFIKDFNAISAPLARSHQGHDQVPLDLDVQEAFVRFKAALQTAPYSLSLTRPSLCRAHRCVWLRRRCRADARSR